MMRIIYKAPLIVLITSLCMTSISAYINFSGNRTLVESTIQSELRVASSLIQNTLFRVATKAASMASLVVNLPTVQKMMREKNRDELMKYLIPDFKIQHEKFHVAQTHFYLPPAISFLRGIVGIEKNGEDLSKTREMVLKANKEQRPLQGIEISPAGVSIRGMDAIKDDQGFIGSFEVQLDFSDVLKQLKEEIHFDAAIFVDNQLLEKISTLKGKSDTAKIIGGYLNIESTDWDLIHNLVTPNLLTKVNDIIYHTETLNGILYGIVILPLMDFKGAQIGSIFATRSFEETQIQLKNNWWKNIFFVLFQTLIFPLLVLILFYILFLKPLNRVAPKYHRLAEGKKEDLSAFTCRNDEIGDISKNIEKLVNKKIIENPANSKA